MGAKVSTSTEAQIDYRVEKCMKTFDMSLDRIQKFWEIFCSFDKDCSGYITVDDFVERHLRISRAKYIDSILDLLGQSYSHQCRLLTPLDDFIDIKDHLNISFGEYVDIICTFACFEVKDLIKFIFFCLDLGKKGRVEKVRQVNE